MVNGPLRPQKLVMPFDRSFFDELRQRNVKEARFIISNEAVNRYDVNRWAILTSMDVDNYVLIESRYHFWGGPKDSEDYPVAEKKVRDTVDALAEESVTVKTGRWTFPS